MAASGGRAALRLEIRDFPQQAVPHGRRLVCGKRRRARGSARSARPTISRTARRKMQCTHQFPGLAPAGQPGLDIARYRRGGWRHAEIRPIKIILARNTDDREQRIAAGIRQCRAHALGVSSFGHGTDRPIGGYPLARSMGQHGGQIDYATLNRGRLNGRDLMLTERLAYDVETARERGIAEAALPLPWPAGPDDSRELFFRVDQL